jgi:hypothetical protein
MCSYLSHCGGGQVQDEAFSRVNVILEVGDEKGYQWKTHPFIDKALHAQQGILALKDPEKQYQIGAALPILKWRMQVLPVTPGLSSVACQPVLSTSTGRFVRARPDSASLAVSNLHCLSLACVQTKDEDAVPLSISCWPSISGGESDVTVEYESLTDFDLQNVVIAIPCHQPPRIKQVCA